MTYSFSFISIPLPQLAAGVIRKPRATTSIEEYGDYVDAPTSLSKMRNTYSLVELQAHESMQLQVRILSTIGSYIALTMNSQDFRVHVQNRYGSVSMEKWSVCEIMTRVVLEVCGFSFHILRH